MLSNDTEMKIIKLFLGIANGDKKIDKIKRSILEKFPFNPEEIFFLIDNNLKGNITPEDICNFLSHYQIPCSQIESRMLVFFYDSNQDGQLDYIEFLNLLVSDSDYLFKKVAKKKFGKKSSVQMNITSELEKSIANLLENEVELSRYVLELISDIKQNEDFSLQDMFYIIKSYSFITYESVKAFFDRNGINYTSSDIKSLFNRISSNKDGKICFNELKLLFTMSNEISFSQSRRNNFALSSSSCCLIDGDYQYECSHLSRSNSPIFHTSSIVRMPILNPPIKDDRNVPYKSYVRHVRETSLSRSKSRSLSRSSDYQSPGEKSFHGKEDKFYNSFSGNVHNNSEIRGYDSRDAEYCNTEQQQPVRLNNRMVVRPGAEKKERKNSIKKVTQNLRTIIPRNDIEGDNDGRDITYEMNQYA